MSAPADDGLEALLDGIWQRRRSELLGRVELLAGHLRRSREDREAWQCLGAEAHRLTGALGSLGFGELARTAQEVERAVAASPDPPPAGTGVADAVARLHDGLAQARSRPAAP